MTHKIIIITAVLLVILVINPFQTQSETLPSHNNTLTIEPESIPTIHYNSEQPVDPDILKVMEITNWDEDIATYFVTEARWRGVSVFAEALPIAYIESRYKFDVINHNKNGTKDYGLFQINTVNHNFLMDKLNEEEYFFDSYDMLDPYLNIVAGIYYIAYLKNQYNIGGHRLFSTYNRGYVGANQYASRNGTYVTAYSKRVKEIKKQLTDY